MPRLAESHSPPPFAGFSPAAFQFFRDLAANQTKTWFDQHKPIYESEIRAPLIALVTELAARLAKKGLPFAGDPQRALFRLNRDVRFTADKSPYKTNAGAAMTRDGNKSSPGVLYFHLDPAGSFTAAGFYRPEAPALHRLRSKLAADPAGWSKLTKSLAAKNLTLDTGDALAKPPRGFDPPNQAIADALKLKSWIVQRPLAQSEMQDRRLLDHLADFALAAAPLLKYGWSALDNH
jgi:uncharacterized protein (TIGR02453 family)